MADPAIRPVPAPLPPPADETAPADPRGLIVFGVAAAMVGVLIAFLAYVAREILVLLYLASLLAIGFAPIVRWIERRRIPGTRDRRPPRWVAVLSWYATLLGVGALVGTLAVPPLLRQASGFATQLPTMLQNVQRWLVARGVIQQPLSVGEMVQQAPVGGDAVTTLMTTVWGMVGGVAGAFTIAILSFYLLVESDAIFDTFIRLVPRPRRRRVRAVAEQITAKVSAWLNGQLMLGAIMGGLVAIGLGLFGVPYFFVLGMISAFGELLPYVGPILAAIPGLALAATISWQRAGAVLVFYLALHAFEGNVLVPRIMESQLGLSAVTTLVAVLLGSAVLGLTGAILAVPTAAIAQVLFHELRPADVE